MLANLSRVKKRGIERNEVNEIGKPSVTDSSSNEDYSKWYHMRVCGNCAMEFVDTTNESNCLTGRRSMKLHKLLLSSVRISIFKQSHLIC